MHAKRVKIKVFSFSSTFSFNTRGRKPISFFTDPYSLATRRLRLVWYIFIYPSTAKLPYDIPIRENRALSENGYIMPKFVKKVL